MSNEIDTELKGFSADILGIMEFLPHRYPFLLIDKILSCEVGKRVVAQKNVTISEPFFQGHFPGQPVMPGVLILEAMAQSAAFLAKQCPDPTGKMAGKTIFLVGADKAKWKKKVVPGDVLIIQTDFIKKKGPFWLVESTTKVDGKIVASATLSAMEVD